MELSSFPTAYCAPVSDHLMDTYLQLCTLRYDGSVELTFRFLLYALYKAVQCGFLLGVIRILAPTSVESLAQGQSGKSLLKYMR
jgi:hypothetical protein